MIRATPNLAGISIRGDILDLQGLYDALSEILGEDTEPGSEYEMPALHILAICYELRQAWQGCRTVEFVENGMDANARQNLRTLGPPSNVYFQTRILLPQVLFAVMALYDFIEIHSRSLKIPALNREIQQVQLFQSEVVSALQEILEPAGAKLLARLVYGTVPRYRSFCTQYVDLLTEKYLKQTPEKRLQQIIPLARRLNELGSDYQRLLSDLAETAAELNCQIADLETINDPPVIADQEW